MADQEFDDAFMASFVFETNLDMVEYAIKKRMKRTWQFFSIRRP